MFITKFSIYKKLQIIFFAALFLSLPFVSMAQEEVPVAEIEEGSIIAEINLSEATIVAQDENKLTINFFLENYGDKPQFDVHYVVELVRDLEDGSQVIADSIVFDEVIDLLSGQKLNKRVEYPLLNIAPGKYSVWVSAQNTGGVPLGLGMAGEFTIAKSNVLEIKPETCFLSIANITEKFDLYQGVDVSSAEELHLSCVVKNHGTAERTVVPKFETFLRTISGDKYNMSYPVTEPIKLAAGVEKEINLLIPKADKPQAYDVAIVLFDATSGVRSSNRLTVHYVLQGASATIQTINFEKTRYLSGEEISLDLFWTPSADGFLGSRNASGTIHEEPLRASVQVSDGGGLACASPFIQTLDRAETKLKTIASRDCIKPTATVTILSSDGSVLDTRSIAVEEDGLPENMVPTPIENDNDINTNLILTVIAFSIILIIILIILNRRKRIDFIQASKLFVMAAVATSGFLGFGVDKVEAVTFRHQYFSASINANKTIYAPGETLSLYGNIKSTLCSNNTSLFTLDATLDGKDYRIKETRITGGRTIYLQKSLVAPSVPGKYPINLKLCSTLNASYKTCAFAVINIEVVAPPASENPVVPVTDDEVGDGSGGGSSDVGNGSLDSSSVDSKGDDTTITNVSAPTINIAIDPELVRSGGTSEVRVDINSSSANSYTCSLRGVSDSQVEIKTTGNFTRSYTTKPLFSSQIVSVSCRLDSVPAITSNSSARIDVIPAIQEI